MTTRLIEECLTIDEICDEIQSSYPVIFVVNSDAGRSLMKKMSGPHFPGKMIPLTPEEWKILKEESATMNWRF